MSHPGAPGSPGLPPGGPGPISDEERACFAALAWAPGIGPARHRALLAAHGSARAAWAAADEEILANRDLPGPVARGLVACRRRTDPVRLLRSLTDDGLAVVTSLDGTYPSRLLSVPDPPPVLTLRGDPAALTGPAVAVVGTRRPTPYGLETTLAIAGDLAAAGVCVVSGLALGVDGAAHRAALQAGGRTVAVLGTGLQAIYPARHAELAAGIAAGGGAVISQFGPDTLPAKANFIVRNRVVAGLALGVVVTEAPAGSGALRTAGFARGYGRPVLAVPGPVTSPSFDGCLDLIRGGARAVASAAHVLEAVGLGELRAELALRCGRPGPGCGGPDGGPGGGPGADGLSGDLRRVLAALGPGEVAPLARLAARTGLSPERLGAALSILEVRGLIFRQPGPSYTRAGSGRS